MDYLTLHPPRLYALPFFRSLLVMLVGYRGWDKHGVTTDSAARFIEHILHAWGINYYLVETDEQASRISLAAEEAERTSKPVAVLIGTEYGA